MKLSIVYSLEPSGFSAVASGGTLEESLGLFRDIGYDGVVLAIRDSRRVSAEELKEITDRYSLPVVAISTGQAFVDDKISLSDPSEEIREKALLRLKDHIDFASVLGARVIMGLIRGNLPERSRKDIPRYVREGFLALDSFAAEQGVEFLLEPLNRYEINFIHTASEACAFIQDLNLRQFRVLLDTFHMNIEEADPIKAITSSREYLAHVDVADNHRLAPGSGHINFPAIVSCLSEIGYEGHLAAEILPFPDMERAARDAHSYMRPLIV